MSHAIAQRGCHVLVAAQYSTGNLLGSHRNIPGELLKEIQRKYVEGRFKNNEIAINPLDLDGRDRTQEYQDEDGVKRVPPVMFTPSPGQLVDLLCL
jgi:hypothetical protein